MDAGADALLHEVFHETAAFTAFGQCLAESAGFAIGLSEIFRRAQRLALEQGIESALLRYLSSFRMHIHADASQQPRIFKLLAFAQNDMTYQRVFALEQRGT